MLTRRMAVFGSSLIFPMGAGRVYGAPHELIEVRGAAGSIHGQLRFNGNVYPCMVGRSGIVTTKHEGDGATPSGVFPLRGVHYRADRITAPRTGLTVVKTEPLDGWCDEASDPAYNRQVRLPYRASAEKLWREDHAYDAFAVIGYNDSPPKAGAGSAIFMHVTLERDGVRQPTAGCVSLALDNLLAVLSGCTIDTRIDIRIA